MSWSISGCHWHMKGPTLLACRHGPEVVSRVAEGDERSELALDTAEDRGTIRTGWVPPRRADLWCLGRGVHFVSLAATRFSTSRPMAQMKPTNSRATAVATFAAGLRW